MNICLLFPLLLNNLKSVVYWKDFIISIISPSKISSGFTKKVPSIAMTTKETAPANLIMMSFLLCFFCSFDNPSRTVWLDIKLETTRNKDKFVECDFMNYSVTSCYPSLTTLEDSFFDLSYSFCNDFYSLFNVYLINSLLMYVRNVMYKIIENRT